MRRSTKTAISFAALVVIAAVSAGCRDKKTPVANTNDDDDKTLADDGADTNLAEHDPELITSSLISSSPGGTLSLESTEAGSGSEGGGIGTRAFGDGARAAYLPRGCLIVTPPPDENAAVKTATYTFNKCFGPNGLRQVTGVVKATFEVSPDNLHLDLTGDALSVNRATVDWHATADIRTNRAERTMNWSAQLSGTTAGGRAFTRTTTQVVTWTLGEACFALSGTSEGKIRDRDIKTEVTSFRRCAKSCPDAGGKISVTNVAKNKQIELIYDGTSTATFVDTAGRRIPVPLPCGLF